MIMLLGLMFLMVHGASSLSCYECGQSIFGRGLYIPKRSDIPNCMLNTNMPDQEYGELNQCNGTCAKGSLTVYGKTVNARWCEPSCELLLCNDHVSSRSCNVSYVGPTTTSFCYCDTDECNGAHQLIPTSSTIWLVTCGILMIMIEGHY